MTLRICAVSLGVMFGLMAANEGVRVEFVGGTMPALAKSDARLDLTGRQNLVFHGRKSDLNIPYDKINVIEYGQNVSVCTD